MSKPLAVIGRLQYDAHTRIIDVETGYTMDQVVEACLAPAVGYQARHPKPGASLLVRLTTDTDDAEPFPRNMTVEEAGLRHFQQIDVFVPKDQ
ncbi:toluene-4-monooxygenase system B family protein [Actinomadura viridis]|uniref:toluene-4-monooxygenase system B family protein n=1 Tax=Actinomadura viridis TaxID=58110 RepID=UPI0036B49965